MSIIKNTNTTPTCRGARIQRDRSGVGHNWRDVEPENRFERDGDVYEALYDTPRGEAIDVGGMGYRRV